MSVDGRLRRNRRARTLRPPFGRTLAELIADFVLEEVERQRHSRALSLRAGE